MVDAGPGSVHTAAEFVRPWDISTILITHHHIDHCLDVATLLFSIPLMNRHLNVRYRPHILLHPDARVFLENWLGQNPFLSPDRFNWIDVRPGESFKTRKGAVIRTARTNHISSSLAFRVESEGLSIVFSGDTGWSDELCQLAERADWLVLECSHRHPSRSHMDPSSVRALARMAGIRHLLLSHFYPDMLERPVQQKLLSSKDGFEIVLARDRMRILLS